MNPLPPISAYPYAPPALPTAPEQALQSLLTPLPLPGQLAPRWAPPSPVQTVAWPAPPRVAAPPTPPTSYWPAAPAPTLTYTWPQTVPVAYTPYVVYPAYPLLSPGASQAPAVTAQPTVPTSAAAPPKAPTPIVPAAPANGPAAPPSPTSPAPVLTPTPVAAPVAEAPKPLPPTPPPLVLSGPDIPLEQDPMLRKGISAARSFTMVNGVPIKRSGEVLADAPEASTAQPSPARTASPEAPTAPERALTREQPLTDADVAPLGDKSAPASARELSPEESPTLKRKSAVAVEEDPSLADETVADPGLAAAQPPEQAVRPGLVGGVTRRVGRSFQSGALGAGVGLGLGALASLFLSFKLRRFDPMLRWAPQFKAAWLQEVSRGLVEAINHSPVRADVLRLLKRLVTLAPLPAGLLGGGLLGASWGFVRGK